MGTANTSQQVQHAKNLSEVRVWARQALRSPRSSALLDSDRISQSQSAMRHRRYLIQSH
jgi:hypothetical protein